MSGEATLKVQVSEDDMRVLHAVADERGASMSELARHCLEPTIVGGKVAEIASSFDYVDSVVLFGSMARGDHDDSSDIDLLVKMSRPSRWMGSNGIGRFLAAIEEATGRAVDFVTPDSCGLELAKDISRDGRLVYAR